MLFEIMLIVYEKQHSQKIQKALNIKLTKRNVFPLCINAKW